MGWELKLMEWANGWCKAPFLDQSLPWLTHLGSHIAVFLFIIISFLLTKKRKNLYSLLLLYGIQSGILYSLKFIIQRERPPFFLWRLPILKGPGEVLDPSFPSAHTLYAFMMATLLANWFPRYRILFFIIAGLIGWTRIYLGLHFPTDVIAGGILGYGITKVFLRWVDLPLSQGKSTRP